MLGDDGKADINMSNYATLHNEGYHAAKNVFPNIQVIIHIQNGFDQSLFQWIFRGLKENGAQWDIIGMSLYPEINNWFALTQQCIENIRILTGL